MFLGGLATVIGRFDAAEATSKALRAQYPWWNALRRGAHK